MRSVKTDPYKCVKNCFAAGIFALGLFGFSLQASAATHYLSPTGSDSGDGSIDSPWSSLDYALNKYRNNNVIARVAPGDTLYLRGGLYHVENMSVNSGQVEPFIVLGSSAGSPVTTISTYPEDFAAGNVAILDGAGTMRSILRSHDGSTNYNVVFENLEVRNGARFGFDMREDVGLGGVTMVGCIFRNIYFHDNTNADVNSNPAGLILAGTDCVVENCTFEDNGTVGSSHLNSANLALLNSYNTDLGAVDPNPRKNNIIRYNRFIGSAIGIKDKGDSNFVSNNNISGGVPVTTHPDWANEIHHNLFLGQLNAGYYLQQDYISVHHNIFDGQNVSGNKGIFFESYNYDSKVVWFPLINNNTFVNNADSGVAVQINPNYAYGYHWTVKNNLFVGSSLHYLNYLSGNTITKPIISNYNGLGTSQTAVARYLNYGNINFASLQGYGFDTSSLNTSLAVTDSLSYDYRLPAESDAIGAGENGVDLGAMAYGSSNWATTTGYSLAYPDTTSPSAPNGLSVS